MLKDYQNKAELIIDWERALEVILKLIEEAELTIKIRMYMWRDDESGRLIINSLNQKIKSCPNIKIYIEKDAFWTTVYNFQKFISIWRLWWDIFNTKIWMEFISNEKNVFFKNIWTWSFFLFKYIKENNHSKVYLFDENTSSSKMLIGWMNISDEYLTPQNKLEPSKWGWHDYMVLITWELSKNIYSHEFKKHKRFFARKWKEWMSILMNIKSNQLIRKELIREFYRARKNIIIEHWYLTDNIIIRKLKKISQKWVKVQIIMPDESDGVYHANMHSIYKLLKPSLINKREQDMEIYLYKGMIHAKVILIDEYTTIIGSANLTNWSFDILNETNAVFRQKNGITKDLLKQLRLDIKNCTRITLWNIPKYNRWIAWLQKIFI
ncbi:MAG: hypothetical protein ACD_3C00006G0001 [uncultured bacterium (gcode 4)]|uniref:PLD phosphodiesterase domain-containing protein n=1 Tax=uncultured bacterium (gcode 4) TaxID=1234023 RepID=K2GEW0_9BACT|nr:MAG: hypothetical protein ACD_3C00006G0001 [uncultured bacterium (gcode 4)]